MNSIERQYLVQLLELHLLAPAGLIAILKAQVRRHNLRLPRRYVKPLGFGPKLRRRETGEGVDYLAAYVAAPMRDRHRR